MVFQYYNLALAWNMPSDISLWRYHIRPTNSFSYLDVFICNGTFLDHVLTLEVLELFIVWVSYTVVEFSLSLGVVKLASSISFPLLI